METDTSALLARINKLEKQARTFRVITIVLLAVAFIIPLGWFAMEQSTLESKSFVLVDSSGKHRAVLGASADGSPSLVFYDGSGKIVTLLMAKSDGTSSLDLYDKDGKSLFKAP